MSDRDVGLDIIGKRVKQKKIIDEHIDIEDIRDSEEFSIEENNEQVLPETFTYSIKSVDAGFNCLCDLGLGYAYKYTCDKDDHGNPLKDDKGKPINEKRVKYNFDFKKRLIEEQLDFILDRIKNAENSFVVVSDIFTRVTTGNINEVLPYKEQIKYIFTKLNNEKIKGKIVAFVRGRNEQEISNNGGPDVMKLLADSLGMGDKLINGGAHFNINLDKSNKSISMMQVDKKLNSNNNAASLMENYALEHPGHDVYFCTNAKQNWLSAGTTTATDKEGNTHLKPCWFISFGPMYYFDKTNERNPERGSYSLNSRWYKLTTSEDEKVRADSWDYTYPSSSERDSSSYVSSVSVDILKQQYDGILNLVESKTKKMLEPGYNRMNKKITKAVHSKEKTAGDENEGGENE